MINIKHTYLIMTCKLIVVWTLNRQAEIFLRIFKFNDWDIPIPKILRIYQWIGKNMFSDRENGILNPLGILPIS